MLLNFVQYHVKSSIKQIRLWISRWTEHQEFNTWVTGVDPICAPSKRNEFRSLIYSLLAHTARLVNKLQKRCTNRPIVGSKHKHAADQAKQILSPIYRPTTFNENKSASRGDVISGETAELKCRVIGTLKTTTWLNPTDVIRTVSLA